MYQLELHKVYEPEASTYKGEAEVLHVECWGPPQFPGMAQIINEAVEVGASIQGIKQLETKIWIDPDQWYNSKIKIEATAHGSPIPLAVWVAIIAGITALAGFVLISYFISKIDWGKAAGPLSLLAIGGILAVVVAGIYLMRKET